MKQVCLSLWVFLALVRGPVSAEAGMTAKRTVLNNGMVLLTSEQRALPMVSIELLIEAGSRHEPADQAGLANLTSKLLIYGTKQRTAVQISDTLDFIGASLEAGSGQDTTSVSMTVSTLITPSGIMVQPPLSMSLSRFVAGADGPAGGM